VKRQHIYVPRF